LADHLTLPESQLPTTAPEASKSVIFSCHLPDTFERARLKAPLMFPEKSEVVPSSFRCCPRPKLELNCVACSREPDVTIGQVGEVPRRARQVERGCGPYDLASALVDLDRDGPALRGSAAVDHTSRRGVPN
jgi:hypothetical protein